MSDVGISHNRIDPESQKRLKSFVDRIEKLAEEKDAIGGDIKDIYSEAKGVGYDVKALREAVRLRKMDKAERDEREHMRDLYCSALGVFA